MTANPYLDFMTSCEVVLPQAMRPAVSNRRYSVDLGEDQLVGRLHVAASTIFDTTIQLTDDEGDADLTVEIKRMRPQDAPPDRLQQGTTLGDPDRVHELGAELAVQQDSAVSSLGMSVLGIVNLKSTDHELPEVGQARRVLGVDEGEQVVSAYVDLVSTIIEAAQPYAGMDVYPVVYGTGISTEMGGYRVATQRQREFEPGKQTGKVVTRVDSIYTTMHVTTDENTGLSSGVQTLHVPEIDEVSVGDLIPALVGTASEAGSRHHIEPEHHCNPNCAKISMRDREIGRVVPALLKGILSVTLDKPELPSLSD